MATEPARRVVSDEQLLRYSRQIFLPEIDVEGQNRLLNASVVLFGMGGLGSPAGMYLASSGVGELILVDPDLVELSNLQRQIVHMNDSLGQKKVESAARTLKSLNPDVHIRSYDQALSGSDLDDVVRQADVVVDGTDNFDARFAINAACVRVGRPLVSAAVVRMEGQISVFRLDQPDSPCYGCLYQNVSEPPQNCAENGVLGSVAGLMGCLQATEVVKVLLDIGETLAGRLLLIDAGTMEWQTVRLRRDPDCPVCAAPGQ
ncbi:MAG: molybdopterin-synthase adenylyltransferase MoeB [Gammaproteobacteria bacterium]|nr:molybdopterin-synthase adenylyltransferase MoeB [Gammaproteobacteria bacterium]